MPHRRLHSYGAKSRIVDALTNEPVDNAVVFTTHDSPCIVKTNTNGEFSLEPEYGWHGAYFLSPISRSLFPSFDLAWFGGENFIIYAEGYKTNEYNGSDFNLLNEVEYDGDFIIYSDIKLHK
ncbi:MAG: hypothetical protein N4A59_12820 [Marinifilum sp.]|nr:hypothetical protein [Marinifilum sp.]